MTQIIKDTFEGNKEFKPINEREVKIYSCGPTVYSFVTIGNLRAFVVSDIIKKSLRYLKFNISDVMNITDVGHLLEGVDDTDDKIERESKKQNKDVFEIIDLYTNYFLSSIEKLNIRKPNVLVKASDTIPSQIELIKILDSKGYVYQTETGVYFDISKFKDYEKYARQDLSFQITGAREEVVSDKSKRNAHDFRLWQTAYPQHVMQWDSPWGRGFPGWHIECSAIIYKYLGESIDIHTGGIDLIYPHHVNEIAQSEGAFSKKFVNFWIHNAMLLIDGVKMAKSLNNSYLIEDIEKKGFNPIALRYFYLNAHYSSLINFTFDALQSAENSLNKIYSFLRLNGGSFSKDYKVSEKYVKLFQSKISNDFDTPGMLSVLWSLIKDKDIDISTKLSTILDFDNVLSLDFYKYLNKEEVPSDVLELLGRRAILRNEQKWSDADNIRENIEKKGYTVIDMIDKSFVIKKI